MRRIYVIKDTHRGLWYEDGKLVKVLEAGRYKVPATWPWRPTRVEVVLVDMRERDLTIKGQEILTADKVAIRVSILVQFQVNDPTAAMHRVSNFEERLYSDVQLAARRSLATMELDEILTNRNRLSEEILQDVTGAAAGYGVSIRRADVKDLIFPGNLQEIMNRVLAAERTSQASLVEARMQAERDAIQAAAAADIRRSEAEAEAEAQRLAARAWAETERLKAETEVALYEQRRRIGEAMDEVPGLARWEELQALRELGANANARIRVQFGTVQSNPESETES